MLVVFVYICDIEVFVHLGEQYVYMIICYICDVIIFIANNIHYRFFGKPTTSIMIESNQDHET